jgi:hypothetical protein
MNLPEPSACGMGRGRDIPDATAAGQDTQREAGEAACLRAWLLLHRLMEDDDDVVRNCLPHLPPCCPLTRDAFAACNWLGRLHQNFVTCVRVYVHAYVRSPFAPLAGWERGVGGKCLWVLQKLVKALWRLCFLLHAIRVANPLREAQGDCEKRLKHRVECGQVREGAAAAAGAVLTRCGLAPAGDGQEEAVQRLCLRLLVSRFCHVDSVLLYILGCIYRSVLLSRISVIGRCATPMEVRGKK